MKNAATPCVSDHIKAVSTHVVEHDSLGAGSGSKLRHQHLCTGYGWREHSRSYGAAHVRGQLCEAFRV